LCARTARNPDCLREGLRQPLGRNGEQQKEFAMSDTSDKTQRGVAYAGAVLLSQLNRLLTEAKKLEDAKEDFLHALSDDHKEERAPTVERNRAS